MSLHFGYRHNNLLDNFGSLCFVKTIGLLYSGICNRGKTCYIILLYKEQFNVKFAGEMPLLTECKRAPLMCQQKLVRSSLNKPTGRGS